MLMRVSLPPTETLRTGDSSRSPVKYSPAGAGVDVHAFAEDGRIRVEVRDRGPGVAPEHQALIFEKFGRVAGEHAKPGTGLGLFIARSIAQAHGGRVEVLSQPDQGSTFTLAVPIDGPEKGADE